MRILVTGADGQLGKCIQDLAKEHTELNFVYTDYEDLDITKQEHVNDFFESHMFDYCINCAAYTAVDKAEKNKDLAYKINAEGPKNLSKVCKKHECILIHISTDFVFNGNKLTSYLETDLPDPINVYGSSKLQGERFVQQLLDNYFIIRTSWVYSEYGHNFMKTMLNLAKEQKKINVVNDQFGSPTYAMNLAEFIFFLIIHSRNEFGVYNYSNMGKTTWYDFSVEIFRQQKAHLIVKPISSEEYEMPAKRPKNSKLDMANTIDTFQIKIPYWNDSLIECLKKLN